MLKAKYFARQSAVFFRLCRIGVCLFMRHLTVLSVGECLLAVQLVCLEGPYIAFRRASRPEGK